MGIASTWAWLKSIFTQAQIQADTGLSSGPIVSSMVVDASLQADGTSWITERHVDDLGEEHIQIYRAEPYADIKATLEANAVVIGATIAALRAP